ncbi:MAG: hydroxyacid dehydrogenase [Bacteroidetes bacterium]|nr:hydroxyacid dehydrogenase [Bacteroidota bacterium]
MKIILVEPIGYTSKELSKVKTDFEALSHEFIAYDDKPSSEEELIERAQNADVLLLSNLQVSENVIEACSKLKMISVAFAGVDHIPMDLCRKKNIIVSNAAGYSNHSVAELTIGSAISLLRKIMWSDSKTRQLSNREGFLGTELYGKTFGIIGTGQIGSEVAHLANAFGCKVLAYNRSIKNIPNVEFCNLDYLLQNSDIITLHVPLNNDTKHLIDKEKFRLVKSSAILINTARGPVVDYNALSASLKDAQIAGAAIDVYEKEPPVDKDHPLFEAPNTILLPHIGYATQEAIRLRGKIVIDNIIGWLNSNPQNVMY